MSTAATMTVTTDFPGLGVYDKPSKKLIDLVPGYNEILVLPKQLNEKVEEVNREVKDLEARVKKMKDRRKKAERNSKVGQVYYTFQEAVMRHVFGSLNVPVYTIQEMEEVFEEDYCEAEEDEDGTIFTSREDKAKAQERWDSLQQTLGWKGLEDLNALEYLERWRYGYTEPRYTPSELKEALCDAKESTWFGDKVIELFGRYIQMCKKLELVAADCNRLTS